MNISIKKSLILVCFSGLLAQCVEAKDKSLEKLPGSMTIGGIELPLGKTFEIVTDTIEERAHTIREDFERQEARIATARARLGERKDKNMIGQAAYDQESKQLDDAQKTLDEDRRRMYNTGDKIENVLLSGIQMVMDDHKIEHKAKYELKAQIAEAAATAEVAGQAANEGAMARLQFILQPENRVKIGTFIVVLVPLATGGFYAIQFAYNYFNAKLGMPTLIQPDRCSRASFFRTLLWKTQPVKQEEAFAGVILSPELKDTVVSLAKSTAVTHEKGLPYRHLLLYGPPGTGKTLIAETLARSSGMDFAMMSGADFSQFKPGADVQELHKVFSWAEHGKRGLVLFIDEADAFLKDRSKDCDDRRLNLVNAFLSKTNSSSEKIMIILASNYAETLDAAVLSRINKKIEIQLPGTDERVKMLQLYIDNHLKKPVSKKNTRMLTLDSNINAHYICETAEKINGFSGRAIDQLVAEVAIEGFVSNNDLVNKELFNRVVDGKVAQYKKEQSWGK